jgi:virulence factor Mce-like protein
VRRLAAIGLVLLLCGAALALGANGEDAPKGTTYELVFDNAFGLTEGGDFKVAGVRAGQTKEFTLVGQARPRAVVKVEVTEPGLADLREDALCEIRPQSLIGEYFVDCQPGTGERLPDGGRLPVDQTRSTIPADLVNSVLRRPYRERLRLIIAELGAGLAGRSDDLNEAIRRAHPGLRETSETLKILGRQTDTIEAFISDADAVIGQLERRKTDVSRFVREAGQTAEIAASRRGRLAATFRRLPGFLNELEPYMGRLGDLAQAQRPVLRNLEVASDDLDKFLTRLPPFAEEATPAFEALGDASVVGRRAVRESRQEIAELRRLAEDAPEMAKPLRQFLQTIDDRKRAVEPDGRAAATDPPAGDKTHISGGGGGFTGMEAIWNYFYWQTLTTNALDDLGHVLRLSVLVSPCGSYTTNPSEELLESCNQFLGPTQPGVTTPDPTDTGTAAAASRDAGVAGERSGPRQQAPGGAPSVQDLLEGMLPSAPPSGAPQLPDTRVPTPDAPAPDSSTPDSGPGASADGLLDFLLGP